MRDTYRAPEVILNMSWEYKVDIWNGGMVVSLLCINSHLSCALLRLYLDVRSFRAS